MGDATADQVRLSFNPQLRIEFRGATVTSDAGMLVPRELDERLGLRALIERHLADPRLDLLRLRSRVLSVTAFPWWHRSGFGDRQFS